MRRSRVIAIFEAVAMLVMLLALSSVGCKKQVDASKSVYKIGAVLSTSGPNSPRGQSEQRSLVLLETKVNDEGGVNGHKVLFVIEDDESDAGKAAVAANKLINQENVIALIGSSGTGPTIAMVPVVDQAQITQVCCAAGTNITHPVKKWVFRTPPTDSMAIDKIIQYLTKTLKVKKIAILHDTDAFWQGGADELKQKAPAAGIEVVDTEKYGSADTDMTAQLTKIKQTPAEALVVWGTNPGPAIVVKNMQQLGITIPFIGSQDIANKKFIELAGPEANGVVFPAGRLLIPSSIPSGSNWRKAVDDFSRLYKEKYQIDIDTFAAHGWDAGLIIVDAMKKAGTDSQKLRTQVEKTKGLVGIDGIYNYSTTDHDGLKVGDLIMIKVENGNWAEVKYSVP